MNRKNLNNVNTLNADSVKANSGEFTGDVRSETGQFITHGNNGWKNETHKGGFYMSDDDWIRTFNNKNITTDGQIKGGTLKSDGAIELNTHLQLHQWATVGTSCPKGGIARDNKGQVLSCQAGKWTAGGTLNGKRCRWYKLPGQDNGHHGLKQASCPVGFYVAGLRNWRGGDWSRTGHFYIQCCQ